MDGRNLSGNWRLNWGGARQSGGVYTFFNKAQSILGANLVWYMGLDDPNGTACALNRISALGNACYVGSPVGGIAGIGDGRTATQFHDDGSTSKRIDITTPYLQSVFNGAEGGMGGWMQVFGASTWTGGTVRQTMHLQVDAGHEIAMDISSNASAMRFNYTACSNQLLVQPSVAGLLGWVPVGITWSKSALSGSGRARAYFATASVGALMTPLSVWIGVPQDGNPGTYIGDKNKTRGGPWDGNLYGFWLANREPTSAEMAALGTWP